MNCVVISVEHGSERHHESEQGESDILHPDIDGGLLQNFLHVDTSKSRGEAHGNDSHESYKGLLDKVSSHGRRGLVLKLDIRDSDDEKHQGDPLINTDLLSEDKLEHQSRGQYFELVSDLNIPDLTTCEL